MKAPLRAYLVDDEPLALKRLTRMLEEDGRVSVAGSASDPARALADLARQLPDVLFLDIEMPGMSGFDLLSRLPEQPLVVFTTAYNQYALRAFEVHSIDYLLKPIEPPKLDRALSKLERISSGREEKPDLTRLLDQLNAALRGGASAAYPTRLSSRLGDHVQFVELARVSHIYAKDKLTFAATAVKEYAIDATIQELEERLDPTRFVRIHRSTIVNVDFVHELYTWFGGRMLVRLKDEKKTELTVARDRVKELKDRLGV
jgi:two-component system, LytTR family, response regulator